MKVVFTPLAERQLDSLYGYIAGRAGTARAEAYIGRIVAYCETLKTFPRRGHARDDLLPGLRVVGFERRVSIAFAIAMDEVLIEGIFYAGRNVRIAFQETD